MLNEPNPFHVPSKATITITKQNASHLSRDLQTNYLYFQRIYLPKINTIERKIRDTQLATKKEEV